MTGLGIGAADSFTNTFNNACCPVLIVLPASACASAKPACGQLDEPLQVQQQKSLTGFSTPDIGVSVVGSSWSSSPSQASDLPSGAVFWSLFIVQTPLGTAT